MNRGDLHERFRLGESEAIAAVTRLARIMVGERGYYIPEDAREDVVQEILIGVHHTINAPGFRIDHGFDALVRSITHRRCVDWMRSNRTTEAIDPPLPTPGPEQILIDEERKQAGARVINSLGPSCRRLIHLRIGRNLAYREIADFLGRTELGVRVQFHKCLKRARDLYRQMSMGEHPSP